MKLRSAIASLFLVLAGVQTVLAQSVVLYMTDKESNVYDLKKVESIKFYEEGQYVDDGHVWVDLGLPSGTRWASCNVGAVSPEAYGDYFAWGETLPKFKYGYGFYEQSYKYCQGTITSLTKYCSTSGAGTVDGLSELLPEDDAATANWSKKWEIPSKTQFEELFDTRYTTSVWTSMKGVRGMRVTSKADRSKYIFLPAAGVGDYWRIVQVNEMGSDWTREVYADDPIAANCKIFNFSNSSIEPRSRILGLSIRPVVSSEFYSTFVNSIVLSETSLAMAEGETRQLTATVYPADAENTSVEWSSNNSEVAQVSSTGVVTAKATGRCTITCSSTDGSGVTAQCFVKVGDGTQGEIGGHKWVDLGLPSGTLWAECNVGASSRAEAGSYFAWGETQEKETYSIRTYKLSEGSTTKLTKYCTNSHYGLDNFVDGLTELLPEDDAAAVNWGSDWQTPCTEQLAELTDPTYVNLYYVSATESTISGLLIESKANGQNIFLPAAGKYSSSNLSSYDGECDYWSRTLCNMPHSAHSLRFVTNANQCSMVQSTRPQGLTVRPVMVQETPYEYLIQSLELNKTELSLSIGSSEKLTATFLPSYAKNQDLIWESSDENVAYVATNGMVSSVASGTCTITCSTTDGSNLSATCLVKVEDYEYVDLALPSGTLWAVHNIGANSPEEFGLYFAWGETEPKSEFTWTNYLLGTGETAADMTKYNAADGLLELLPQDDAATVNWNANWQTPSKEQFEELLNEAYTTIEKTTLNNVSGRKITSKVNNKSIFLPNSGNYGFRGLEGVNQSGSFWSRTLNAEYANDAHLLLSQSSNIISTFGYRFCGKVIRPVRKK